MEDMKEKIQLALEYQGWEDEVKVNNVFTISNLKATKDKKDPKKGWLNFTLTYNNKKVEYQNKVKWGYTEKNFCHIFDHMDNLIKSIKEQKIMRTKFDAQLYKERDLKHKGWKQIKL